MVPSLGVPVNISFTWWGPEGEIRKGNKYEILNNTVVIKDNDTVISQLVIHNLESSDNLTMYYCSVVVDTTPDNYSVYIIPAKVTSENSTLVFEGEQNIYL